MNTYQNFLPKVIIEATQVCDLSCDGCYAGNILSKNTPEQLIQKFPSMFLSHEALQSTLESVGESNFDLSIRGGEPSLHPNINSILETSRKKTTGNIYFETHGRWLLGSCNKLANSLKTHAVIAKISYDSMHGTSKDDLKSMVKVLQDKGIDFLIAITEFSEAEFLEMRKTIPWVKSANIVFQKKAKNKEELIDPEFIVAVNGKFKEQFALKRSFGVRP